MYATTNQRATVHSKDANLENKYVGIRYHFLMINICFYIIMGFYGVHAVIMIVKLKQQMMRISIMSHKRIEYFIETILKLKILNVEMAII